MDTVLWWHLHQPDYREPSGKTAGLPWVRMHALRAYTDLCAMALDTGLAGMTINIVPSLADQLDDIANERCEDRHHMLARRVADGDTSAFASAFASHATPTPRPIVALDHFDTLRAKAASNDKPSADDVTDACALFHLSWMGFTLGERPEVRKLLKRGRGYTKDDLAFLLALSREASAEVLQRFRTAREAGLIHLTTTPYFHPILPLVVDGQSAKDATSDGGAPEFSFPDDAKAQLIRAADRHEELFGERPKALWPSEGALSEAVTHLVVEAGFEVAASDEELLRRSLDAHGAHDVHLHPWKHADSGLGLLFRDRALSDDWGFVYRDHSPDDAARAFGNGVSERERRGGRTCAVILDGENPFEFYPGAGRDHLYAFAKMAKKNLHLVSPEVAAAKQPQRLRSLRTGSWIHASLDIWAGDDEDRRGWALLNAVRNEIDLDKLSEADRKRASHHLFAAEGSDWFWWYGPEFDIPDSPAFDALFRGHLVAALEYANQPGIGDNGERLSGEEADAQHEWLRAALERPVSVTKKKRRGRNAPNWPSTTGPWTDAVLTPLERANATHVVANEDGGAMHRGASVVEDVWVLTTHAEIQIAFRSRSDVDNVTAIVHGEMTKPGGEPASTSAQRKMNQDDRRLHREGGSVYGRIGIGWDEVGCKPGVSVRVQVDAAAGAASESVPAGGLVVVRPRTSQFEA